MTRMFSVMVGLTYGVAIAVPPAPLADPSGTPKNRYISMSVPSNDGEQTALRVTLVSLHHVNPPYGGMPSIPFSSFEGEHRWVGPPVFATENTDDPTPFVAAPLQCAPYYHNWSTLGLFHVYGDAVVPSSIYDVAAYDQSCQGSEDLCADTSPGLQVTTSRFADVIAAFNPPDVSTQPQIDDVFAVIDKVLQENAASKASLQLQANIPDPFRTVNVADVLMGVNAMSAAAYPWSGPSACGQSSTTMVQSPPGEIAEQDTVLGNGATLKVFVTPVPSQGTGSYPPGAQILGQQLIAPVGGFRAFLNIQLQDWNPDNCQPFDNCPPPRGWQIQLDRDSLLGVNADPPIPGVDVTMAEQSCVNSAECTTAFGEPVSIRCSHQRCIATYINVQAPDWICRDKSCLSFFTEVPVNGPMVGAVLDLGEWLFDDGNRHYIGTMVVDIPAEAAGHIYTLKVRLGDDTMAVAGEYTTEDLPISATFPAVFKIGTRSDATGINRCRFISFVPGHSGEQMAIRVKLVSLHHVDPPYAGGPSIPFTSFEGQYRWVGPPTQYVESTSNATPFFASSVQCSPHYQDWSSAGYLHVTGSAIVPSSLYDVQFVPASCMGNENSCAEISAPLTLATTRWADIEAPFNPPSANTQPDLGDVSALVNKFKNVVGAPIKARALLAGSDASGNIDLSNNISFAHISACVDAFKGAPYPHTGPESCP